MHDTGPAAFIRQQQALIARRDYSPLLSQIAVPTLVLVGEDDQITPPEFAREMAGGIAGSRLVTVPRCGHLSTLEAPGIVTDALKGWLED
jgi:pimeloyl-ACP methyl ester carboxylesterase